MVDETEASDLALPAFGAIPGPGRGFWAGRELADEAVGMINEPPVFPRQKAGARDFPAFELHFVCAGPARLAQRVHLRSQEQGGFARGVTEIREDPVQRKMPTRPQKLREGRAVFRTCDQLHPGRWESYQGKDKTFRTEKSEIEGIFARGEEDRRRMAGRGGIQGELGAEPGAAHSASLAF